MNNESILSECIGEYFGTFFLVYFGTGTIAVSVFTGAYDLTGVSLMWFVAVIMGVYTAAAFSGGHINPAVTLPMAIFTDFSWSKVLPYMLAQTLGAFSASVAIHIPWQGIIAAYESSHDIVRGEPGSQLSAMIYPTYAPNPAIIGTSAEAKAQVPLSAWFASQTILTALLVFGVFILIEHRNELFVANAWMPALIAIYVAGLVAYEAPISMASLNPARDLGPRVWAYLAGWGEIAFPGPRGGWWIPTAGHFVGGIIGGVIYFYTYEIFFPPKESSA